MEYDDLFIRCYLNTSQHFQVQITTAGFVPEGGALATLPISAEDIEKSRRKYTAIIDKMRQVMMRYSIAKPEIQQLQQLQQTLRAHPVGQHLDDFRALRDSCEVLVKYWDMPRGEAAMPAAVDYSDLLKLSQRIIAMFPGSSIGILKQSLQRVRAAVPPRGLRVILDVEPNARQLLDLPWEILVLPAALDDDRESAERPLSNNFLFLNPDVSLIRQVRTIGTHRPFAIDPGLPMQVFVAQSKMGIQVNTQEFWQELSPLHGDQPPNTWWSTDPDTLRSIYDRLSTYNPQIVQLICHGKLSITSQSNLQRCDLLVTYVDQAETIVQRVSSYDLITLLRLASNLQLVILTVCDSSGAQNPTAQHSIVSNLAYELVRAGIPTVVGIQGKIAQTAAAQFSGALYHSLQRGNPLDQAVSEARIAIASRWVIDWTMPVVYRGSDRREQGAWHTRLADWLELLFFDPGRKRGVRAGFICLMLLLLVGSSVRWLLLPSATVIDVHGLQMASVFWGVIGAFSPLPIMALMNSVQRHYLDREERGVVRRAQFGGALLGYVLSGFGGLMVLSGLFNVFGDAMSAGAWLALLVALVGWSLLVGYTIARSQVRGARANWRLYTDTYSFPAWAMVDGAMLLMLLILPLGLATETVRSLLVPLFLHPGLGGVITSLLGLGMLVNVERS